MSGLEPTPDEMKMPDPHLLRVELSKLNDYLLNLDHMDGRGKALFFRGVGFSEEATDEMAEAFRDHAAKNKIVEIIEHQFGVKTVVECFMETPSGKSYCVRSVWIDHLDGNPPRLVTALPMQPGKLEGVVPTPDAPGT